MPINDPVASGLEASEKGTLDWNNAPVLKERISPVDRAMSPVQATAYQAGTLEAPPQTVAERDRAVAPAPVADPALNPLPPDPAQYIPQPVQPAYQPPPAPQPQYQPGQVAPPPPTSPAYPQPANDRISRLYGERQDARNYAADLERRLLETNARLDSILQRSAPPPAPNPALDPLAAFSQPQSPAAPPAGEYISRAEFARLMQQERAAVTDAFRTAGSQRDSQAQAARDFPDVFNDPRLRADADRIWNSDPALRADPNGPYKVAALARGLSLGSSPPPAPLPNRTALAGLGVTVPEGSGNQPTQEQRFYAALAHAQRTQRHADFVHARNIQMGRA